ncbi:hypothetical protein [Parasitella parasitica]|uniref:NAD(+) diphosphatase n=1 Tax=Parasitella parasitica TaxID=35722 RepID=A0A0B7MSB0_9FUNG|nr:hypothetical protein [Parasitella parasitica]
MSVTLFEAAAEGNLDYLKKNVKFANEKNERGWTPLHFAARFGQLEAARFLKDNKADLSIVNGEGKTAAQVASFWGNDEIAKLLTVAAAPVVTGSAVGAGGSPYPDNYTAVFAGNPLNRFGWNRGKPHFLAKIARSPRAKYLILNGLKALYNSGGGLYYARYNQVASVVDRVYTENDIVPNNTDIILIFLGIDESQGQGEDGEIVWALDLTPHGVNEQEYSKIIQGFELEKLEFLPTLPRAFVAEKSVSAIIAQAAAMVDWNARAKFCSACGKRTISQEAGYKRSCPTTTGDQEGGEKCISHTGIQNFAYPRTDAVIIVCIVHPNGDKILLGRQKRWPNKMFSCISGFVEAAETLEEAVRREAFEETGIVVDRVAYHSSQPWPFPNSLMLGFIAEAVSTDIHFRDDELESAQWFTRTEVIAALKGDLNATFSMAPKGSLASTLVHAWVNDKKWQQPGTTAKM